MGHAQAFAGKELVINGKTLFVGLFKWPVQDEAESYFAALLINNGGDNWSTVVQLPPMPIASPVKGATATMTDILTQFNTKIAEVAPTVQTGGVSTTDTWLQRLKKLFDGVTVQDGKIVLGTTI